MAPKASPLAVRLLTNAYLLALDRIYKRLLESLDRYIQQTGIPDHLRQDDYYSLGASIERLQKQILIDASAAKPIRKVEIDITKIVSEPDIAGAVSVASEIADRENVRALNAIPGIEAGKFFTEPGTIEEFRSRNVSLIKTLAGHLLNDVEQTLASPEASGLHVRDLLGLLDDRFQVSRSRAEFWAVDQTLKLNADISQKRMVNVGIRRYVWTTSNDERVRGRPGGKWQDSPGDHWALEGKVFAFGEDPVTDLATGERNPPGRDYRCRCTAYPLLPGDEEET